MAKKLSSKKKLTIFILTFVIVNIILLIVSILFSFLIKPASQTTDNNGNAQITVSPTSSNPINITTVVDKNKEANAKAIKTIDGKPLSSSNFPYKYKDSVNLDISSEANTPKVIVKPCTSKADAFAHKQVITVDELKSKLKELLKTDISDALKQSDIDASNNSIDYSYDSSC